MVFERPGKDPVFKVEVETGESANVGKSFSITGVPPNVPIKLRVDEMDPPIVNKAYFFEKSFNVETTGPGENDAVPFQWRLTSTEWDITLHGKFHVSYGN